MKSSRKRKVTAAFFAAAALGGVAHAAPTLNMNDLVGSNTATESTTQATTNVAAIIILLRQSYDLWHLSLPL